MSQTPLVSKSSVIKYHLQPAGAAADKLSRVELSPAFHEAYLYSKSSPRLLHELVVIRPLQAVSLLIVKSFDGESGEHFMDQQRPRVRVVQCGRLNEDRITAAIINPNTIHLLGQLYPISNLAAYFLHQLTFVVRV